MAVLNSRGNSEVLPICCDIPAPRISIGFVNFRMVYRK
jgi:hypothetical protein